MVSSRTKNRQRKLKYLESWIKVILKMITLSHIEREHVNMAEYKKIDRKLKNLYENSKITKKRS